MDEEAVEEVLGAAVVGAAVVEAAEEVWEDEVGGKTLVWYWPA